MSHKSLAGSNATSWPYKISKHSKINQIINDKVCIKKNRKQGGLDNNPKTSSYLHSVQHTVVANLGCEKFANQIN